MFEKFVQAWLEILNKTVPKIIAKYPNFINHIAAFWAFIKTFILPLPVVSESLIWKTPKRKALPRWIIFDSSGKQLFHLRHNNNELKFIFSILYDFPFIFESIRFNNNSALKQSEWGDTHPLNTKSKNFVEMFLQFLSILYVNLVLFLAFSKSAWFSNDRERAFPPRFGLKTVFNTQLKYVHTIRKSPERDDRFLVCSNWRKEITQKERSSL